MEDRYYSLPLEKGLRILRLFSQGQQLTLQEVSGRAAITKTSAFRFCNTLVQLGYLRKDPRTKLLDLGTEAFMLGSGLLRGFNLYQVVKPFLDEACNAHGVTVDSSVFDGKSFTVLYRREVAGSLTYRLPMMTDALTCTALGKAMLAFLPEDEQMKLLEGTPREKKTEKTLLALEDILADLRLTRQRGYSLNNEEFFPGFIAIGAPIINANTQAVIGAVCFDFPTAQFSIERVEQSYSEPIVRLGRDVSNAIPY